SGHGSAKRGPGVVSGDQRQGEPGEEKGRAHDERTPPTREPQPLATTPTTPTTSGTERDQSHERHRRQTAVGEEAGEEEQEARAAGARRLDSGALRPGDAFTASRQGGGADSTRRQSGGAHEEERQGLGERR